MVRTNDGRTKGGMEGEGSETRKMIVGGVEAEGGEEECTGRGGESVMSASGGSRT